MGDCERGRNRSEEEGMRRYGMRKIEKRRMIDEEEWERRNRGLGRGGMEE